MVEMLFDLSREFGPRRFGDCFPYLLPLLVSGRDSNWYLLDLESLRDCEPMPPVDEEKLAVATDVDDDLVVAVESVAISVLVRGQLPLLDEFLLPSVSLIPDAVVESVDLSTGIPHVFLARTASPDDVSTFCLLEHVLDKLNILPVRTVLEALPECLDDREILEAFVVSVPVATFDRSEVLPLEPSWVWISTGDVDDLGWIGADDFEGISDGWVWSGIPPVK